MTQQELIEAALSLVAAAYATRRFLEQRPPAKRDDDWTLVWGFTEEWEAAGKKTIKMALGADQRSFSGEMLKLPIMVTATREVES